MLSLSSSGVGTTSGSHSGSAGSSSLTTTGDMSGTIANTQHHQSSPGVQRGLIMPGMHVVCVENFSPSPHIENGLPISQGEIIEGEKNLNMFVRLII